MTSVSDIHTLVQPPVASRRAPMVVGPIDALSASTLQVRIAQAAQPGIAQLVVDLGAVTLLASAGVDALYRALHDAERQHVRLRLTAPSGSIAHHMLILTALPHDEEPADAVR